MKPRERIAFDAIVRAARAGEACPQNAALADLLGATSVATGAKVIADLERAGHITVERFGVARDVTIPSLGLAPKPYVGSRDAHWRKRETRTEEHRSPPHPRQAVPHAKATVAEEAMPPRVDRDPCPRCGVRRDVGCAHSGARIGMGAFG